MKILVVSGFLGAGKTTFIRTFAERTKKDFAVMENEYGAVNVDGDLLEQTGVGMLSKIIENIRKIEYERITLLEPVTILDGNMYERCMSEFSEICEDQIQTAGRILVSKMEYAAENERCSLKQKLTALNPEAESCVSHYTEQGDDWWDSLLISYLDKEIPMKEERELDLENLGLTEVSLQSEQELILFLQGVVFGVFGDICRAKGYLPAGNGWLRFDVTDRTYSVTGIDTMPEAKAIFIGRQLKRNWLREVLQKELYVEVSKRAIRPMRKRSAV